MRLAYTFYLSLSNLKRRKLRGFLTVGGMAVGIALVVFLVSLGFGLQQMVVSKIADAEALSVLDVSKGESTLLTLNDDTIQQFNKIENVDNVSPSLSLSGQVVNKDAVTDVAIYGVKPDALSIEGIKINTGQTFSGEEAHEMVISATALSLIGFADYQQSIGTSLDLKFLVPKKSEDAQAEELVSTTVAMKISGVVTDDSELSIIYAPLKFLENLGFEANYQEAKVKVEGKNDYNTAKIKVTDESKLPEVRRQIEEMGYQVDSIADTVGQIDRIFLIFELVVAGFGAIAMFVAAMGALNTLTVSLLERTREIGLMKALGAVSGDIYRLFLVESILIGMTGGVIGIFLGLGLGEGANFALNVLAKRAGGQPVDIFYAPFIFIVVILAVCLGVSFITGLYPARRASKINALDALRYE
jgi:putative ABC transport system permease protein